MDFLAMASASLLLLSLCAFQHAGGLTIAEDKFAQAIGKPGAVSAYDDRDSMRRQCLLNVKDEYRKIIGPHLRGRHAVLVDMVFHWNLGDSFIQLGNELLMSEYGTPPRIPCALQPGEQYCNYTLIKEAIAKDPRQTVILIQGGGNFGDLFIKHRHFQNAVISTFPQVPIVFLPQSVYYKNESNAKEDSVIRAKHPKLQMLARDLPSLNYLRKYFPAHRSDLCPDGAQMLGPIDVQCEPKYDVFFLTRTYWDPEKVWALGDVDKEAKTLTEKGNLTYKISDWSDYEQFTGQDKLEMPSDPLQYPRYRTALAMKVLCQGRMIVTDRLHAVMLSTLMGLPHVYLECSYGKTNNYRQAIYQPRRECSDNNLRAHKAETWSEAVQLVLQNYDKDVIRR